MSEAILSCMQCCCISTEKNQVNIVNDEILCDECLHRMAMESSKDEGY